jgi:hypothetical protein
VSNTLSKRHKSTPRRASGLVQIAYALSEVWLTAIYQLRLKSPVDRLKLALPAHEVSARGDACSVPMNARPSNAVLNCIPYKT